MNQFAVVVLAAGGSSRMGSPKQLLTYQGKTFLAHTLQTAQQVFANNLCVVLGGNADKILEANSQRTIQYVINHNWEQGMGTSIAYGLDNIKRMLPDVSAVMFVTVDQPFVTPQHLQNMITEYNRTGKAIVASRYQDTIGIPAMFSQEFFAELLTLQSDKGAKKIIQANAQKTALVPLEFGEIDIDTPEQFAALNSIAQE